MKSKLAKVDEDEGLYETKVVAVLRSQRLMQSSSEDALKTTSCMQGPANVVILGESRIPL
jgi:hypothetical protein